MKIKREFLFLFIFAFGVGVVGAFGVEDVNKYTSFVSNKADTAWRTPTDTEVSVMSQIYDVKTPLSQVPSGNMNSYVPQYKFAGKEEANKLFAQFGFDVTGDFADVLIEQNDYYERTDGKQTVRVYKFGDLTTFEAKPANDSATRVETDQEAVDVAARFFEDRLFYLGFEETEVNFDGEVYNINFINRIGNIKNHAFVTSAVVSKNGQVSRASYYNTHFIKLSSNKTKSMQQAFYELPNDALPQSRIVIERCTPVYVFEDSIVQPAYLFMGKYPGGKTFKCYVNASVFGQESDNSHLR